MGRASGVKLSLPLCAAAAATIAAICYLNTLGNQFVFDDLDVVVRNPLVTGTGPELKAIFTSHYWAHLTPAGNLYRPLTILSFAVNHRLSALDPAGYHMVNLLLHALCSGLVVVLASRLGLSLPSSLAAGALFAAHPIHTEAVTGVVGRAELMSAAGVLAAWILHLGPGRTRPARSIGLAAFFMAALLSKENAIVLPALMIAGDVYRNRREPVTRSDLTPSYLACAVAAASWLLLRVWLLPSVPPGSISESVFAGAPVDSRLYTALGVVSRYVGLLCFPLHLSADYSFEQIPLVQSPWDPLTLCGGVLLASLGVLALVALGHRGGERVRQRHVDLPALCAAAFAITLAPVSNLLVPIGTIMAERLLYLPSVPFCIALPAVWTVLAGRPSSARGPAPRMGRRLGAALAAILVALGGARTLARNGDWKDQLTLFSVTTRTSPRSAKAHHNLGVALQDSGREQEALSEYQKAIAIKGDDARSLNNAGLILASLGRLVEAAARLEEAARIDPALPDVFSSLGAVYSRLGRERDTETVLRAALARGPDSHAALYNLGTLLLSQGRAAEAVTLLERARAVNGADPDGRYQLGLAYLAAGRPRDALPELRETVSLSPAIVEAHLQIALAYLRMGDTAGATAAAIAAHERGVALPPELRALLR